MNPDLYTIRRDGPGQLSTMARPPGGDQLAAAMAGLASAGVNVCVSLLTDAEMTEMALAGEGAAAAAARIEFRRLPTADFGSPDRDTLIAMAADLAARLGRGDNVVVHCRGGIGRSSIVAAAVMIAEGTPAADALERISAARGRQVPETDAQRAFVASLDQAASPGASHR
jgi:protein-tyrosine phosphatase